MHEISMWLAHDRAARARQQAAQAQAARAARRNRRAQPPTHRASRWSSG